MRIDAPEITGSLIVSGSISISGSLNLNGSNVSSGNGGTVSPGTISGSTQISALGFVSSSVTGSSLISASIAGNTITLNKGNGTTLAITLPDGSIPTDITALNAFSASTNLFTASASHSIATLNSWTGSTFTTYSASVSTSVGLLQSTASYLNTTFSSSVNSRLIAGGGGGSTDITALNASSASMNLFTASIAGTNPFTASASHSIATLNSWTGSTFTTYTASVSHSIASLNSWTGSTFATFSTSVDSRLDIVEATASLYIPLSTSVDSRLDIVEATASLYIPFSTSVDSRLDIVEATASLYIPFSTSVNSRLIAGGGGSTDITALNAFSASINSFTASAATTGSNRFTGNQTVTGSVFVSGSLRGNILIANQSVGQIGISVTQSMDFSKSNFFTLTMQGGVLNHITASNVQPGQTVSLKIYQPDTVGTASFSSAIKFPSGFAYTASSSPFSTDIITFITYDTETVYASSVKNMI